MNLVLVLVCLTLRLPQSHSQGQIPLCSHLAWGLRVQFDIMGVNVLRCSLRSLNPYVH